MSTPHTLPPLPLSFSLHRPRKTPSATPVVSPPRAAPCLPLLPCLSARLQPPAVMTPPDAVTASCFCRVCTVMRHRTRRGEAGDRRRTAARSIPACTREASRDLLARGSPLTCAPHPASPSPYRHNPLLPLLFPLPLRAYTSSPLRLAPQAAASQHLCPSSSLVPPCTGAVLLRCCEPLAANTPPRKRQGSPTYRCGWRGFGCVPA